MKYTVDGWNNFCRVFMLPVHFSHEFCSGAGIPTNFQMMDWFNPVDLGFQPAISKDDWIKQVGAYDTKEVTIEELKTSMVPFLEKKNYYRPIRTYLVICNFGATFTFGKEL